MESTNLGSIFFENGKSGNYMTGTDISGIGKSRNEKIETYIFSSGDHGLK